MNFLRKLILIFLSVCLVLTFTVSDKRYHITASSVSQGNAAAITGGGFAVGNNIASVLYSDGRNNTEVKYAKLGKVTGVMTFLGVANDAYTLHQSGIPAQSRTGKVLQASLIGADILLGCIAGTLTLCGIACTPLTIACIIVGGLTAFVFSDFGNSLFDKNEQKEEICPPNDVDCYKPNIYIYTDEPTEVTLTFRYPQLLKKTVPQYKDCWNVIADNGKIYDGDGQFDFLFYESLTDYREYQYNNGFIILKEYRKTIFTNILKEYGFNEKEIADFNEFWDDKLSDTDYIMYPQTTEIIDETMPINLNVEFDNYFRIWFGFVEYNGQPVGEVNIVPFTRDNKSTLVEWGGFIAY